MLIARTWLSLAVKLAIPAWYAVSSRVQPPVNAAGKKARITFFLPRKSDSLTATWLLVLLALIVKSGATSPFFERRLRQRDVLRHGGCGCQGGRGQNWQVFHLPLSIAWQYSRRNHQKVQNGAPYALIHGPYAIRNSARLSCV